MTLDLDPIIKRADQLWCDIGNLTLAEARTSPLPALLQDISVLVGEVKRQQELNEWTEKRYKWYQDQYFHHQKLLAVLVDPQFTDEEHHA